jgi:hypothetical protein
MGIEWVINYSKIPTLFELKFLYRITVFVLDFFVWSQVSLVYILPSRMPLVYRPSTDVYVFQFASFL